jgi:uncharacterized phage-associated protein
MASVHDIATYILEQHGPMSAMKLEKLVYYSQAWSLVWDERPLFPERIEAWANGPVCPDLYEKHRGTFMIYAWPWGRAKDLNQDERDTVNAVLAFYGDKTPQWLSDLTHSEEPWKRARVGLSPGARSGRVIAHDMMAEYYSSLLPDSDSA